MNVKAVTSLKRAIENKSKTRESTFIFQTQSSVIDEQQSSGLTVTQGYRTS